MKSGYSRLSRWIMDSLHPAKLKIALQAENGLGILRVSLSRYIQGYRDDHMDRLPKGHARSGLLQLHLLVERVASYQYRLAPLWSSHHSSREIKRFYALVMDSLRQLTLECGRPTPEIMASIPLDAISLPRALASFNQRHRMVRQQMAKLPADTELKALMLDELRRHVQGRKKSRLLSRNDLRYSHGLMDSLLDSPIEGNDQLIALLRKHDFNAPSFLA